MRNNRRQKQENKNYGYDVPQDDWQKENIRLRAGKGSAYDKYSHLTHKTGYGYDSNRGSMQDEGRTRNLIKSTSSQNLQDADLNRSYKMTEEQGALDARKFLFRFLDLPARFIDEVAEYLQTDVESAYRITRAVFLAIRDRVDPRFAIFFGQSLPLVLRGIYFDDFNLSNVPVVIRNKNEFIHFIQGKIPGLSKGDFNDQREVIMGLRAVFRVLEKNMSQSSIEELKRLLYHEIVELVDSPKYEYSLITS